VPTRISLVKLAERARARGIERVYVEELAHKFALELSNAQPARSAELAQRVPSEYSRTLRAALRRFHETHRLAENPLLDGRLVEQRAGRDAPLEQRLAALRALLQESVLDLARTPRTEPAYKALHHTYIDPEPTQLLAAEAARMSFGTYRRHLAAGLDELAIALWLRDRALRTD
jgi:hypothetical protein